MFLLIDNFDSFSHILADLFLRAGVSLRIVRNDISLDELKSIYFEAIVLSPGPETPQQAGNLMEILGYYKGQLPILGVCLGHQAIGMIFGAKLGHAQKPMHGKVSKVTRIIDHPVLFNLPDGFSVTRYHSLILRDLPEELQILLKDENGEIMAMAHKTLPIIGLQFHPEAYLTEYGFELITNWVALVAVQSSLHKAS